MVCLNTENTHTCRQIQTTIPAALRHAICRSFVGHPQRFRRRSRRVLQPGNQDDIYLLHLLAGMDYGLSEWCTSRVCIWLKRWRKPQRLGRALRRQCFALLGLIFHHLSLLVMRKVSHPNSKYVCPWNGTVIRTSSREDLPWWVPRVKKLIVFKKR